VHIVVAIEAEQLPITAVRGIVVVVVVPVVDRELTKLFAGKLPSAPATDMGENPERPLPIGLFPQFPFPSGLGYDTVNLIVIWTLLLR
jgi:hypothetical protein